jgi:hypothetical protein
VLYRVRIIGDAFLEIGIESDKRLIKKKKVRVLVRK